jgi:predicted nucleic acid-binding protein
MSDIVVDSSVVAKWILPEADSPQAQRLFSEVSASGGKLIVLDLMLPEVANSIWKRVHRNLIGPEDARNFLNLLMRVPVELQPAATSLPSAFEIAVQHDRPVYDALFVALAHQLGLKGVTADEPLWNAVRHRFPQIVLLRDW